MLLVPGLHERLQPLQLPQPLCATLPDSELPINPAAWLKTPSQHFACKTYYIFNKRYKLLEARSGKDSRGSRLN